MQSNNKQNKHRMTPNNLYDCYNSTGKRNCEFKNCLLYMSIFQRKCVQLLFVQHDWSLTRSEWVCCVFEGCVSPCICPAATSSNWWPVVRDSRCQPPTRPEDVWLAIGKIRGVQNFFSGGQIRHCEQMRAPTAPWNRWCCWSSWHLSEQLHLLEGKQTEWAQNQTDQERGRRRRRAGHMVYWKCFQWT